MGLELAALDATAQAELVRSGECSAAELLEASHRRGRAAQPAAQLGDHPARSTSPASRSRPAKLGDGPFRGVPLLLKDLGAQLGGTPQYGGTRFLRDHQWVSPHDSEPWSHGSAPRAS